MTANTLKALGYLGLITCLCLFAFVGVPVANPVPTLVLYAAIGLAGAGALRLAENADR